MIPEPGDPNHEVHVAKKFHEQTNEELTKKEVIQMEADDQAIQTILTGLLKDIYAAIDKNFIIPPQQADCTAMYEYGQDRQMQMVGVHNVGNKIGQNVVQNLGIQNVRNQNRLIGVPGIANQIANQNQNVNVVASRAEGNGNGTNGNLIRCYNCRGLGHYTRNCTVRPKRRDAVDLQTQLLIAQKEEAWIQLQAN
nr:hypothetical protein [Tanacetum cinerariifolium]